MAFLTAPLLAAAILFGGPLEMRPSFKADAAAWAATDVVVVTEGDEIDGRVTVIEAWVGGTAPGTKLTFESLLNYRSKSDRTLELSIFAEVMQERETVEVVTGDRMVLFLAAGEDGALSLTEMWLEGGPKNIVWIEEGRAFARIQERNPGSNGIRSTGLTEPELHAQVERTLALRKALNQIESFSDPLVRVMAVAPHCHDQRLFVQDRAFEILVASGPSGVACLRSLALNRKLPDMALASQVLESLATASPEALVATLNEMLAAELEYWARGELPDSWWSVDEPTHQARTYRLARNARLAAALRAVDGLHALEEGDASLLLDAIAALKSLWERRPELAAFTNSSVSRLCGRILQAGGR